MKKKRYMANCIEVEFRDQNRANDFIKELGEIELVKHSFDIEKVA
jgi:hypothetical protein